MNPLILLFKTFPLPLLFGYGVEGIYRLFHKRI